MVKNYFRGYLLGLIIILNSSFMYANESIMNFTFKDSKGNKQSLINYSGKTILIHFFGLAMCNMSISHKCRDLRILNDLYKKYKDLGLVVIAIDVWSNNDEDVKKTLKYFSNNGIDLSLGIKHNSEFNKYWNSVFISSRVIPTTTLINYKGEVKGSSIGYGDSDKQLFNKYEGSILQMISKNNKH